MTYDYLGFENLYNNTKPIRGRSEDVRPIGRRSRCWERVVRGVESADKNGDVTYWYGAQLYNTVVVKYLSNGVIELAMDGWATPSTADFMTTYLPYGTCVTKDKKNLWLRYLDGDRRNKCIIPKDKPLLIKQEGDKWVMLNAPVLKQRVIDRKKMKAARDSVRGFIDFTTTMLKLSDGWLMAETLKPYTNPDKEGYAWGTMYDFGFDDGVKGVLAHGVPRYYRGGNEPTKLYQDSIDQTLSMMRTEDTELWQRMMYQMLEGMGCEEERNVRTIEVEVEWNYDNTISKHKRTITERDYKYNIDSFKRKIDTILQTLDVYTVRIVRGDKIRENLIA